MRGLARMLPWALGVCVVLALLGIYRQQQVVIRQQRIILSEQNRARLERSLSNLLKPPQFTTPVTQAPRFTVPTIPEYKPKSFLDTFREQQAESELRSMSSSLRRVEQELGDLNTKLDRVESKARWDQLLGH